MESKTILLDNSLNSFHFYQLNDTAQRRSVLVKVDFNFVDSSKDWSTSTINGAGLIGFAFGEVPSAMYVSLYTTTGNYKLLLRISVSGLAPTGIFTSGYQNTDVISNSQTTISNNFTTSSSMIVTATQTVAL